MSELTLVVDGTQYRGWTNVEVRRGLEQIADRFELELAERWNGQDARLPLRPGEPAHLEIDGERVLTGYLDDVLPNYDGRSHTLVVSGRSKTADLVDCSGEDMNFQVAQTVAQVARAVADPFGIEVVTEVDVGAPLRAPSIEAGQPYAEALSQLARHRALLLVSDVEGRLVITRPPRERLRTELALGENIREARGRFSFRDRFSEVTVEGQGTADDSWFGPPAAGAMGRSRDEGVGRYRPTLVLSDTAVDSGACRERADWEVRQRFGRSRGVTYTVAGWRHQDGLWRPGDTVPIRDPWVGLDGVAWLIEEVQLVLDDRGERAELRVVPPSAYDLRATPEEPEEDTTW